MSILKREDNFVSLFSFMKDNSSVLFSSNNIHFVQKESIKAKILRLLSAQVKICQILYVNFETSRFLSISPLKWKFLRLSSLRSKFVKFLMSVLKRQIDSSPNFVSLFNFMKGISSVLFLAQTIYTLLKRNPLKWRFLKLSSFLNDNSSCQLWNSKSVPLQILHNSSLSWQITPLLILSSYFFKFGLKDPIKIPISGAPEKFAIFLMSFSKPQVSWK